MRIGCPIASILILQVFVVSFLSRKKAIAKQYRIVSACVQIHNIRIEHFFFQLNWHNRLPSHHISLLLWLFIAARMRKSISASECSPNFLFISHFHWIFSAVFLCGVHNHTHTQIHTYTNERVGVSHYSKKISAALRFFSIDFALWNRILSLNVLLWQYNYSRLLARGEWDENNFVFLFKMGKRAQFAWIHLIRIGKQIHF